MIRDEYVARIEGAMAEARRFLTAASAVLAESMDKGSVPNPSKRNATMLRSSMDVTRCMAHLRKGRHIR